MNPPSLVDPDPNDLEVAAAGVSPSADPVVRLGPLAAAVLVLVGFVLRVRGVSEYWLNADEGIYYSTLTHDAFAKFWAEVVANAHPPAYYLLLRGLGYLTWDFVWLRGASVLFGTAAIWVFWAVGREMGGLGRRGVLTGLIAAAWLAFSPEAIALSQVLRPYTLVVLLLAGALLFLLQYRRRPDQGALLGYAVCLTIGVLTHYSVALGIASLTSVLVHDFATGRLRGKPMQRIAAAHLVPCLLFGALFVAHTADALGSDLMGQALGPGGWLREWLVDSPEAAWRSLVTLQNFHVPQEWRVRAALLLLAAVGVSAVSRERVVALLVGSALAVALGVSVLGVYPFGPSRHNAWLIAFTIPALAWLLGRVAIAPRRFRIAGPVFLTVLLVIGHPLERAWGGPEGRAPAVRTVASGERTFRFADLAPFVVDRLDGDGGPEVILMTDQTFNVLMPLFSLDRREGATSPDSTYLSFPYGGRQVVVARSWDWSGRQQVTGAITGLPETLAAIDTTPARVLVLAGGWGSALFGHLASFQRDGAVAEQSWVLGTEPDGRIVPRMGALVLITDSLPELSDGASRRDP